MTRPGCEEKSKEEKGNGEKNMRIATARLQVCTEDFIGKILRRYAESIIARH